MGAVSFVFQDDRLFKRSLADNVRAGRPNASDAEVLAALHAAQCDDIIAKFPGGVNTVVGKAGVYLSGGELPAHRACACHSERRPNCGSRRSNGVRRPRKRGVDPGGSRDTLRRQDGAHDRAPFIHPSQMRTASSSSTVVLSRNRVLMKNS